MSASSSTPLDYVAEGYWQDFLAERPIAGGIAYEIELHSCQLDESLASLQRVDTLLSQIRRDRLKSNTLNETMLLANESYRNLLIFLAFYAGRVLARQWQHTPHWYGQFELRGHYPNLPFITDNFYQHMAVLYRDSSNQNVSDQSVDMPLFFALEPIGLRLFGHIDRQFKAVQGGKVASGLYQAVSTRLPNSATDVTSTALSNMANSTFNKINNSNQPTVNKTENKSATSEANANISQSVTDMQIKVPLSKKTAPPTPEIFTQLLIELDEIKIPQTTGNDDYQQARKILDQFEQHIAKQNKPRVQVMFSKSYQDTKQQALIKLKNAADLGNTDAMLRLAMYELLGEGLIVDTAASQEAGIDWVKQATNEKDSRAQRLLSRMYYQGVGVPQDINTGKFWLEQAAENGHKEAAGIVGHWQQAQVLMTTQKQEQHSIKRYQILIGVVVVAALLLLIFV